MRCSHRAARTSLFVSLMLVEDGDGAGRSRDEDPEVEELPGEETPEEVPDEESADDDELEGPGNIVQPLERLQAR
jgi:hypothetical protein